LLFIQEFVVINPAPEPILFSADQAAPPEISSAKAQSISRTLLRTHHLLSTQKRKSILNWCSELQLWGISKVGYPGVIIVEGRKNDVDEFERRIKSLNWLALNTRWQEDGEEAKLGPVVCKRVYSSRLKVIEVENVSEVGELMREAGLEEMFQSVFRLG
jgi:hypothetical protein